MWDDAYILNYLFDYKILENRKVGFPDNALNKITDKLNELKIQYQIIYDDRDPIIKRQPKNTYAYYLEQAKKKIDKNTKAISLINKIENADDETFDRLMSVLDEFFE